MDKIALQTLNATEQDVLRACELVIDRTKNSFVECGKALERIRDGRLYRATHPNFDSYCLEKWGWGKAYSHRLIEAAAVKASLGVSPMGDNLTTERQARELGKVAPVNRPTVLQAAAASGKVTAATIKQAAEAEKPQIELDRFGRPIPAEVWSDWQRAEVFGAELRSAATKIKSALTAALETKDVILAELVVTTQMPLLSDVSALHYSLGALLPYCVCPTCQGKTRKTCQQCRKRGYISKHLWPTVPEKLRNMLEKNVR